MYGLSANKSGAGEGSTVLLTAVRDRDSEKNFLRTSGRLLTDCTLFIAKGGGGGGGARVFKNLTAPSKHCPLFPLAINNVKREWAKRVACEYSRFS